MFIDIRVLTPLFFLFLLVNSKCPKLVVPFGQVNCTDRATDKDAFYYFIDENISCVPTCKSFVTQSSNNCIDGKCMPGAKCEKRCNSQQTMNYTCTEKADCAKVPGGNARINCLDLCINYYTESCMSYHSNTDEYIDKYWRAMWKPVCDNDENYVPKQCKGGLSGRCMCFSKIGKRIFGEAPRKDSDDMTCACSRRKSDLESSGNLYVSLHCDSKGNYEKLQCDVLSEQCWCAEPKTGDLTSPAVPMKAMKKLPCYISSLVGSQYLRQCESEKYALTIINHKLKTHGVRWVSTSPLLCDDDGSYGNYYMKGGIAYCTWRDHSQIETWQSNSDNQYNAVDCRCARDYKKYKHAQSCSGSGSYQPLQQVIMDGTAYYYCVDSDGFAKTDLFDESGKNTDCSKYY